MKKYEKRSYIDPRNKIGKYIKFDKRDKVICDFIDYVAFYGSWNRDYLVRLLASDNGPSVFIGRITLRKGDNPHLLTIYGDIVVAGLSITIFRLQEIKIKDKMVLKVDLYGKGVKLIREENLWPNVYSILKDYCLMEDITLTRADYTVDCAKYNFRKPNSLRCTTGGVISKANHNKDIKYHDVIYDISKDVESLNKKIDDKNRKIQYKLFGNKSSSTARFIRYYDKKREIVERGMQNLYPEYFDVPYVMRYELQVNSKGFEESERNIKLENIYDFITFGYNITDNTNSHKRLQRNTTMYEWIKYGIRKLQREKDYESLEKIKLLLFSDRELGDMDCPVLCEISDLERLSEPF